MAEVDVTDHFAHLSIDVGPGSRDSLWHRAIAKCEERAATVRAATMLFFVCPWTLPPASFFHPSLHRVVRPSSGVCGAS